MSCHFLLYGPRAAAGGAKNQESLAHFGGRVRYVFLCRLRFDGFRYTAYVLAGSLDRLLRPPSQVLLPHHRAARELEVELWGPGRGRGALPRPSRVSV